MAIACPPYAREGVAAVLAAGGLVNAEHPQRADSFVPISRGEVAALVCQASPRCASASDDCAGLGSGASGPLGPSPAESGGAWGLANEYRQ